MGAGLRGGGGLIGKLIFFVYFPFVPILNFESINLWVAVCFLPLFSTSSLGMLRY